MSGREPWPEVKSLLEQALEVPPAERAARLAQLCADPALKTEVEELLALEGRVGSFIAEPVSSLRRGGEDFAAGHHLGPWRLLRPLSQGGMGTVYLAERADGAFELTAAVKLLRAGLEGGELVARFEAERQILARLIHPNIARLLDGGTSEDGRPYLVMEYVEGEPIDEYCDRRSLPLRARLELFRSVCAAVQLAHQSLIVHRDLKPANILVTAGGTVKLLDFGIAKLLAPETHDARTLLGLGGAPLTPRYASPEQIRGEPITTASDVYSLGVLLYELATGHPPYRLDSLTPTGVERAVCETIPPRPSTAVLRGEEVTTADGRRLHVTAEALARARQGDPKRLARRLSGDLDTILLKALRKEPERRFASAEQLSEDLRLFLEGLPIRSRPDSFGYRAGKFVGRHALGVAVGAGALVLVLAFAAVMAWQRGEIAAQSRETARERDRAQNTKEFLLELIGQADPRRAKGQEITVREALDQRAGRLAGEAGLDPATRADLLDALGVAYRSLGRYEQAGPLLEEALALRRQALGDEHVLVAESLHNLANLERNRQRPQEAERLIRQALAIQRRAFPQGHRDLARGLNNLASLLRERAEALRRAAKGTAAPGGEARPDGLTVSTHGSPQGGGAPSQGFRATLEEAETVAREGLAMKQRLFGEDNAEVTLSLNTLAAILVTGGKPTEAEPLFRRSIELRRKLDGPQSPGLAKAISNLAVLLADQGRLTEAEALHREALAMRRKLYEPEGHPELLRSLEALARLRARQGERAEAETLLREALLLAAKLEEGVEVKKIETELATLLGHPL